MRWIFGAASGGVSNVNNPALWLTNWAGGNGGGQLAGVDVTESTVSGLSAYYRALANIGEDVARTHFNVYKRGEDDTRIRATDHPIYNLLRLEPNPEMSAQSFWEAMLWNAGGWGMGIAQIERAGGRPVALWPIHPSRVELRRDANGALFYRVYVAGLKALDNQGRAVNAVDYPARDIFHLHGVGRDGLQAISILRAGDTSHAIGIAAQNYGASWYKKAIRPTGVLTVPSKLDFKAYDNLRKSWNALHGGPNASEGLAILEQGSAFNTFSIPPDEAQFLQTRTFQIVEACRWFRMPPHKIMELGRATWANVEQADLVYVGDTLGPWFVRIEQECTRKLLLPKERGFYYVEFNPDSLLRMETRTRTEVQKNQFMAGGLSPNDIRRQNNLPVWPFEEAELPWVQSQMVPMTVAAKPKPAPQPAGEAPPDGEKDGGGPPPEDNAVDQEQARAATLPVIAHAVRRVLNQEHLAVKRCVEKHGYGSASFEAWAKPFYDKLAAILEEETAPGLQALATMTGAHFRIDDDEHGFQCTEWCTTWMGSRNAGDRDADAIAEDLASKCIAKGE